MVQSQVGFTKLEEGLLSGALADLARGRVILQDLVAPGKNPLLLVRQGVMAPSVRKTTKRQTRKRRQIRLL